MKGKPVRHNFGRGNADAYKWVNADGSAGGIVARSARVHNSAVISEGVTIGEGAYIGPKAVIDEGAGQCDQDGEGEMKVEVEE